jgi:hypothetical protein
MCVIMIVEKGDRRPTAQMLEKAWNVNGDGAGFAWREGKGEDKHVVWKKGLGFEDVVKLAETLPVPYVLHFRAASIGGVRPGLTHPFPIETNVPLDIEGKTKGYVLFHNGHWKEWDEAVREVALRSGTKIPLGKWSDTRGMAFICSVLGPGFMELLTDQRGVAFNAREIHVFTGKGWSHLNGIWCSNEIFMQKGRLQAEWDMCDANGCYVRLNLDNDGRCPLHPVSAEGKQTTTRYLPQATRGNQGVSNAPAAPFLRGTRPTEPIFSMELVEKMQQDGKISNNLKKGFRKMHDQLAQSIAAKNEKSASKAQRKLETATRILMDKLWPKPSSAGQRA